MKLYNTSEGVFLDHDHQIYLIKDSWDSIVNRDGLEGYLTSNLSSFTNVSTEDLENAHILAPIDSQEIWAAGVTWLRSRDARMEESETAASLYDLVYNAERPELFFKATKQRVAGNLEEVYIRKDSTWNVPEPELTLFMSSSGSIQGYTIGNDMSSRSIEGENALYLPQAKIYEKCAGLGPCLYVTSSPLDASTTIRMSIKRNNEELYNDSVAISRIKRSFTELAGFLFRECDFPNGCFLMTGTCLVPPNEFTLQIGDVVTMSIDGIGTLINTVAYHPKYR
jgi:2-dehydro-3-deoxy-D-arabinonate dehydratase